MDKISDFISLTYFKYLGTTKNSNFFSLRSKFFTIKMWKFFNIMNKKELLVSGDVRLYFNLKGESQARDNSGNLIPDRVFHQYMISNYTSEHLQNSLVVMVNNLELGNPVVDYDYGPEVGSHSSHFSKYQTKKSKLARFNIKTSLKEFRGAGRNFSPDSTSIYIGLYEWNGNLAKKETQKNILKWTIGK